MHRASEWRFNEESDSLYCTSLEKDSAEGASKVLVENSVDDGIEGRVHVAQPEGEGECEIWNIAASLAGRYEDVQEEEWQPARNETSHYNAQNQRRPFLLLPRYSPLLLLRIARPLVRLINHRLQFARVVSIYVHLPLVPATEDRMKDAKLGRFHGGAAAGHA